ncbi:SMC-Scp complex subunit ScpB [Jeotgalibacillus soli]|uniref:Segregation and condensation protein B n=1 Tax=Jeotgalibacillus soli TaxID=889306 RepID=A0A0C2VJR8_9BACL|nr:SMC-Scp complex subunit ScpB [Jeotgalibacillus soli]KIL44243.1 segregation and condensation protein B [Jeotgalibacillus soli]
MDKHEAQSIIESLLFAAGDEGLNTSQLSNVLMIGEEAITEWMGELKNNYISDASRGIQIVELAGTFQLATKRDHANYIKRLVESPSNSSLSQAALETLAIIAYRQPITRIHIEDIRGVKTDRPLQTLASKGLIKEKGRAEGAGRAILYGTTDEFLDYFGLKDLSELPPLPEDVKDLEGDEETDLFFKSLHNTLTNE